MLTLFQAIILGIVQGLTEFIPVSSSAHLVIVPWLFGWPIPSLLFDTVVHWGTLISIIAVFWRDLWAIIVATVRSIFSRSLADPEARLGWYIVVGCIPAAAAGVLFQDFFEALFSNPLTIGFFLLVTAALLAGSEQLAKRRVPTDDIKTMNWGQTIIIGVMQAVALVPGISRSGSTMAAGLASGLRRSEAARFSFLLGTPVFLGAAALQFVHAAKVDPAQITSQVPELVAGLLFAAIVGYLAIRGLLAYLRSRSLYVFSVYCLVVGLLVIGLSYVG